MDGVQLRRAVPDDARFLSEMLVEAANWSALPGRSRVQILDDPRVSRYISGWLRPGDLGLVATDENGTSIGAGWLRLFPADQPGSGFVSVGVPELTLGVNTQWRARGIGRSLLRALHAEAAGAGHSRVSLSVDRANHARRLYVSEGYTVVASDERADVMVRVLP
ncbi:GNAT family N-acetyltransferase [Rathayibacter sp. CAU 1779]